MIRYRRTRLTERQRKKESPIVERLRPLTSEQAVSLSILTTSQHGKKVVQHERLLVLTPGSLLGMRRDLIMVSHVGKGAALICPFEETKARMSLVQAGMPSKLVTEMIEALKKIYGEVPA